VRRIFPALGLFFAAPLAAEYLPGNFSITMLGMLVVLAPMYGGGALLIRETVRRAGRGWPSIFLLALAYGILEEGLIMQSLFNPNFYGLNQHLLQPAYIAALGIGGWWTVFVLTLHTVWSIPVPIAIVEALAPKRAGAPWLPGAGLAAVAAVFLLGSFAIANFTMRNDSAHFVASRGQLAGASAAVAILIVLAFRLPRSSAIRDCRSVPRPSTVGLAALLAASAFLIVPNRWGWWAVSIYVILFAAMIWRIRAWWHAQGWGSQHRLALAAGAAFAYAWHAFLEVPAVGAPNRYGNAIFAGALLIVIWIAARKPLPLEVK
jgi:hypothetical protein